MSLVGRLSGGGEAVASRGEGAAGKGDVTTGAAATGGGAGGAGAAGTAARVAGSGREPDNGPGPAHAASSAVNSIARAARAGTLFFKLSVIGRESSP